MFTYRRGFAALPGTLIDSDAGWGCMIRTAQMMLHEAVRRIHGNQIDLFTDQPTSAFSIHRICHQGRALGIQPGQWYGPSLIQQAVKPLCKQLNGVRMVLCQDGTIYLDQIQKKLLKKQAVYVSIALRLGLDSITSEYLPSIKEMFAIPQCIGMIGGQNDKSLYFIGIINSHVEPDPYLIYLDPHLVQDSVPRPDNTYFCKEVKTV